MSSRALNKDLEHSESAGNLQKIRDRTKSVGDVPRQIFLPFSSRFQVSSSFKFYVFLLLKQFLDVCYFTLITPFRFTKRKIPRSGQSRYFIQTNPLQQCLSTLVIICLIIYAFLDLRFWIEQKLKENPQKAFQCAYYYIRGFMPVFWAWAFWVKRNWFEKLLLVCQGKCSSINPLLGITSPQQRNSVKPSRKLRVAVMFLLFLTIGKVFFQQYRVWRTREWVYFLVYNTDLAMYNLHLKNWTDVSLHANNTNPYLICMGGGVASFFYLWDDYLENMFDLLCFIGAAMVYSVCSHFSDEMEKLSNMNSGENSNDFLHSKRILRLMQTNYVDLIAILESINEVYGSLIVIYFLRSYPMLVWSIFEILRHVSLEMGIFHGHKIVGFILVTVTAAEGSSKVQEFKQWLFQQSVAASTANQQDEEDNYSLAINMNEFNLGGGGERSVSSDIDMASLNVLHREVSTESLGLKGYKFFTVTHGLIGTILGVVVTYAVVMLQFEREKLEQEKQGSKTALYNAIQDSVDVPIPFLPKVTTRRPSFITEQSNVTEASLLEYY